MKMIKIKESPRQAEKLSQQLRLGSGGFLTERRAIVGLSLIAVAQMWLITLYQVGIIKHLPNPPLPHLNSDKVDASAEAYEKFEMPDAILAIGNYTVTMGLAAMGGKDRVKQQPWIPLLLAAKVGFDTFQAVRLYVNQLTRQKALCPYCIVAALSTVISTPLVIPEASAALRALSGKRT